MNRPKIFEVATVTRSKEYGYHDALLVAPDGQTVVLTVSVLHKPEVGKRFIGNVSAEGTLNYIKTLPYRLCREQQKSPAVILELMFRKKWATA